MQQYQQHVFAMPRHKIKSAFNLKKSSDNDNTITLSWEITPLL